VGEHCPNAIVCMDPFHVTRMATEALDVVRRDVWNEARRQKDAAGAKWLKGARWALWKAPERLTDRQRDKLAQIQKTNRTLYRAYLLKEHLRAVFHQQTAEAAIGLLDAWTGWARRSRLQSFVKLARTIRADRTAIVATLTHRLSNARMEAANTTIRLITRRAYGFHSATALIALAMLTLGGLCPPLPGRL
jgi:transposase